MALPQNIATSMSVGDLYKPKFADLDVAKKAKLVAKCRSQWSVKGPPDKLEQLRREVHDILREQSAAFNHSVQEGHGVYLTQCASRLFSQTSDLLAPHANGTPLLNEAVLTMAGFMLKISKPVLARRGLREDVVGLAQLDSAVMLETDNPFVLESLSSMYFEHCFGVEDKSYELTPAQERSEQVTGHILWMGMLAVAQPPLAIYMSYIHHLALQPLDRRRASYARTIAWAESLLVQTIQSNRLVWMSRLQKSGAKPDRKGRVIWIMEATDEVHGRLARAYLFEEAMGFKSGRETLTVYLVASDPNEVTFTGTWPCGKNVKVHIVSSQEELQALQGPELVFLFHPDLSGANNRVLSTLCNLLMWGTVESRPIIVLTFRSEAEVRSARGVLDVLKAQVAWQFVQMDAVSKRDHMGVRNLFSGMAGNPDMEFDDNGWMIAVMATKNPERVHWWSKQPQDFFDELKKRAEAEAHSWAWTDKALLQCEEVLPVLGNPASGDAFTPFHLEVIKRRWEPELGLADLVGDGFLELVKPEEPAEEGTSELQATATTTEIPQREEEFRVVYSRVMVRAEPSTKAQALGVFTAGAVVSGVPSEVDGQMWLRMRHATTRAQGKPGQAQTTQREDREAWMLIDGQSVGLGVLLERMTGATTAEVAGGATPLSPTECKEREAEAAERTQDKASRLSKSPAVFWGILDLKYDPKKRLEDQVKVLETGDGRLSRFSGYGAAIKESFQQEHKLEETIRRAVLTENKKLTHDVIVESGYGHVRPRQIAFPKEYTADLSNKIRQAFGLEDGDICVLKLCNRARGAGVIPALAASLDEQLQQLLQPPDDLEDWLAKQSEDWARRVQWGCFEEQVRHWWSNECPCFLVEEWCRSASTEKDERWFDGTMRVGFSLHREYRNKLPRGWVDSENGPVRVRLNDGEAHDAQPDEPAPHPWNDDRPYMDLFRPETTILRLQWLGGYWKLPVEDVDSKDLRGKIVSVAKQGTAPVPECDLHAVYAALGDMVSLLFGSHDMAPAALKARYKDFPELGSYLTARLACSMRVRDKTKSAHMMELAQMHIEKRRSICKDIVSSYIYRNLGVAEAGQNSQWTQAAEHFRRSIEVMPCNANARHLLGVFHLEQGEAKRAAEVFESVLLLDPDFKAPYACLGVARLRLREYARAAEVSKAGLVRHPYTQACQYNLGCACFALAYMQEQQTGGDFLASELRSTALEALQTARDQRFRDQPWGALDDAMVAKLRDEQMRLVWSERKLPQDGWRVIGWRP